MPSVSNVGQDSNLGAHQPLNTLNTVVPLGLANHAQQPAPSRHPAVSRRLTGELTRVCRGRVDLTRDTRRRQVMT